ncbi:hypothetical protein [Alteraurantiacibacter buctensis]|uniref:Uncharacterized protein n=1 Tax=Alteraurantiacibacter buctensis TaxID=1503981 RepID=A0A844Z0V8_9SPHN|nr:hypothetical protein [Alteraurantiacibacter buctensis]MXO72896.1 hypothetical protein [Alteraurantiacibacter buctensis]
MNAREVADIYLTSANFTLGFRLWAAWKVLTNPTVACATICMLGEDLAVRRELEKNDGTE